MLQERSRSFQERSGFADDADYGYADDSPDQESGSEENDSDSEGEEGTDED